jgi:hypothetical protein
MMEIRLRTSKSAWQEICRGEQLKIGGDALHDIVLSITNQTTGIRSDFRFRDEDRQEKK